MLWYQNWNFGLAPSQAELWSLEPALEMLHVHLWVGRASNWCTTGFFWASWLLSWFFPFPAAAEFGITKKECECVCVCVQNNFSILIFGAIASQLPKEIIHCFITILGFQIYPSKQTASW